MGRELPDPSGPSDHAPTPSTLPLGNGRVRTDCERAEDRGQWGVSLSTTINPKIAFTVYVRQASFTHPLLPDSSVRVGRGSRVGIRVDDSSVSREHAELTLSGCDVFVRDLGSANGTQLLRRSTPQGAYGRATSLSPNERYSLRPGDVLQLGGVSALLQVERAFVATDRLTTPPQASGGERVLLDPSMKKVYELASRAACSDISVLIMGETGVGKELLAAAVHEDSPRRRGPFLQLNCAALAENLLESELFGHEKGAFTGASHQRAGLLESAQGGTVFLDELGEMPLSTQAKLLRVLEERKIRRLGSTKKLEIDVRFVAATNCDLHAEVAAGRFREDLFYRISGITLKIPPLRQRLVEIEPLARQFLVNFCLKTGISVPEISDEALERLLSYPWPGNVRELKNAMERAPFFSAGAPLGPEHLPSEEDGLSELFPDECTDVRPVPVVGSSTSSRFGERESGRLRDLMQFSVGSPASGTQASARERMASGPASDHAWPSSTLSRPIHGNSKSFSEAEERRRVTDALEACSGNQTRAAELLGVSRRTLINRIETFGIPRPRKQKE